MATLAPLADATDLNGDTVLRVVNCTDMPSDNDPARLAAIAKVAAPLGPRYGDDMLMLMANCAGLDVEPDPIPPIHPVGAATPTLLVGSVHDPATPMFVPADEQRADRFEAGDVRGLRARRDLAARIRVRRQGS